MAIPILKQGAMLITSLPGNLTDAELADLERRVIAGAATVSGIAIDLSEVDVIDSFACRTLTTMAVACKACGASVVVTGIRPDVAFSMAELGLVLSGAETALDLDEGIGFLLRSRKRNE